MRQFSLPTWNSIIGQFIHPVGRGGGGVKGVEGVILNLARCKFHFIREHDNLV